MKKHVFLGAALLSLFATSCSNEDIMDNGNEPVAGTSITLQANITGGSGTRMAYEDDETNKELKFSWSDAESFNLYKGTGSTATTFSKTANDNIFTGTIPGGGTDTYYAVYGNNIKNTNGVLYVNIANQTGVASTENGITTFMLAQAKYLTQASGMTPTLDFQHKLGVMKLTLTLPDGVTGKVSKITISGLNNKARYTLRTNTYSNETKGDITVTNGSNGFAITGNKITAYVAVFPENVSANQVMITTSVGYCYYAGTISAKTFATGKVVPVNVTVVKKNFKSAYTAEDYKTWSTENCGSSPTYDDMCKYLGAGVYWDKGAVGANQQTYTLPDGKTYHTGLWVMKKAYISSEVTGTSPVTIYNGLLKHGRPAAEEIGKYFFLPAAGVYDDKFSRAGSFGYYWSSSPFDDAKAYYLSFSAGSAHVTFIKRASGILPMVAE